jgi:hypothetical protein
MSNAQNIYQKHFGDIGTKIDEKNPQFGPPGMFLKYALSRDFYIA